MSEGEGDIIIKGGSVKIVFDDTRYPSQSGNRNDHQNNSRKITQIRVLDGSGKELYSSGENNSGLDYEVRVTTN